MQSKQLSLVTGGAGFIGSHITRELLKSGHRVIVLDDLSGGFEENIPSEVIFIKGSITDHLLLEKLFNEYKIDYIYHLAAYAAEGLSHFIKRFNYTNNLTGSVNLINEAVKHKIKCFVFTSSIAVYGSAKPPVTEDMELLPEDPYGIAKLAVEQDLKCTHEIFGLNYIIFRPHNVYGEYQNLGDKYRNVVGIFINALMQNKPVTIFGNGDQTRAFSYIGDIAPYIANCINIPEAYNQIFNIGADQEFTINELAKEIMNIMKTTGQVLHVKPRNEVAHIYAKHDKAKKFFKCSSPLSLQEGLKRMVDWAKKNGVKKSKKFENIELYENLPATWLEN